jgi:integrase
MKLPQTPLCTAARPFDRWQLTGNPEVNPANCLLALVIGNLQRLQKGTAEATINRGTQLLSQGFKLAIERRYFSTAPRIRHLSEKGNARQGFFSDTEFRSVASNLPDYLHDFTRFGYLTGWRKGEIASLRWEDVDDDIITLSDCVGRTLGMARLAL